MTEVITFDTIVRKQITATRHELSQALDILRAKSDGGYSPACTCVRLALDNRSALPRDINPTTFDEISAAVDVVRGYRAYALRQR